MIRGLLNPDEILILSYGLGLYRITSAAKELQIDDSLKALGIFDLFKVKDGVYVAISNRGHIPNHIESAIQDTEEFQEDRKAVIEEGPQNMKDRFYELHMMTHA